MESDIVLIRFQTCNSLKTQQQWVIWKTENDENDYIRICQRRVDNEGEAVLSSFIFMDPYLAKYNCLSAKSVPINLRHYQEMIQSQYHQLVNKSEPIVPNKEARNVFLSPLINEGGKNGASQEWKMNITTNQLSNVKYPKVCMTTRHYRDPEFGLLLQCKDDESPNPQLPKHQRFYLIPALDKNGKQLCFD